MLDSIHSVGISDFRGILNLADEELGIGYITRPYLESIIQNPNMFCDVMSDTDSQVRAFLIYGIITYEDALEITKNNHIEELKTLQQIGVIKTVAVVPEYRRRGAASALIGEALNRLRLKGIVHFISPAWWYCGITPIAGILKTNGFIKKLKLPNYWTEYSIKEKVVCPICGEPPCHCGCEIFIK